MKPFIRVKWMVTWLDFISDHAYVGLQIQFRSGLFYVMFSISPRPTVYNSYLWFFCAFSDSKITYHCIINQLEITIRWNSENNDDVLTWHSYGSFSANNSQAHDVGNTLVHSISSTTDVLYQQTTVT